MDTVHNISVLYRMSPFEILDSDVEDFLLLINYLIDKGNGGKQMRKVGHDPMWDML